MLCAKIATRSTYCLHQTVGPVVNPWSVAIITWSQNHKVNKSTADFEDSVDTTTVLNSPTASGCYSKLHPQLAVKDMTTTSNNYVKQCGFISFSEPVGLVQMVTSKLILITVALN